MTKVFWSALATACVVTSALAQSPQDIANLQHQLDAKLVPTKVADNKQDIVTAGTILTLRIGGLTLYPATVSSPPISTYKNGKLSIGFKDGMAVDLTNGLTYPGGVTAIPRKTLGLAEKAWIYGSKVEKDKALIGIITEPYDDGRYSALIKIEFPKGSLLSADDIVRILNEVGGTELPAPAEPPTPVTTQTSAQSSAQDSAPAPMVPIPPPPPPPDTPPAPLTISLGQTKDQVIAAFGQPQKIVRLGATKEIDYYPDMKVTFVGGKVSDVQ